ncbi:conserved Plasmodium protein, unknown function [Plasmodium gallinaceum]|uniref:Uncharacterized protein n=1 Tax=Plasmodium gallinaceum TaxID=5849 RepID=A0A1J1GWL7_PLAGA|nr:conserved Plasmodium protein, unknown function [Plasmodium gallinaceum]CRG95701.1 conserved Plasmodium protein, unknown function [Plasmodium gallinaceum]
MNENQNDDDNKGTRSNKILRGSLLDDQFNESNSNKLFLCNEKYDDETEEFYSRKKINAEKPNIDRSLINNFSTEKYREFLVKIEKSNQDLNNMDSESVRIDKDMLNPPDDNNEKTCVVMDVSMGIFDVCNENLCDSKLKDMNITVSEVIDKESVEKCEKDLIQEI